MNAQYEVVKVSIFYKGQNRDVFLHVIKTEGRKNPVYFLRDYHGWAIDGCSDVWNAVLEYNQGRFTPVEITD
jgi:hypothetical protein